MESNNDAITVTVGIFSGRRNPELKLDGETASRFVELLRSAIGNEPIHPLPPPRLGEFYGFFARLPAALAKDLNCAAGLSIRDSVISCEREQRSEHWRDQGNIEEFLMNEAYGQGLGEILEKVGIKDPRDRPGYEGPSRTSGEN